jgi:LysM repeat protein
VPRSGRPRAGNHRTVALRRQLVRVAAPAAFLLAATIAVMLVRSALRADEDDQPAPATVARITVTKQGRATTTQRQPPPPSRTYTVQEGDTLDEIAVEHDATVQQLLVLNPGVEPTELRPGQRLRVP